MTSTPVKDVSFGLNGLMPVGAGTKGASLGEFRAVWNNQTGKTADGAKTEENSQTVRKTPGDSLKARDEHRARTEKREPSRNVEERTDIPEEKLEEVVAVLGTAVTELIQQVADTLDVSPEEVEQVMDELGLEQTDLLNPVDFGKLILEVSGAESTAALVTNEELYSDYRQLMEQLEVTLQESADTLELEPEQVPHLIQQLQETGNTEMVISVEITDDGAESVKADEGNDEQQPLPAESVTVPEDKMEAGEASASRDNRSETKEEHRGNGREQEFSPFTQNLKVQQFEPQIQQTVSADSVWDADTQNIMRQIMDYMKINLKPDMSSLEMQLHPASLGTLQVQVASRGGVVTASFITQNEAVKAALESQMVQLKNQFEEQGIKVEVIEVNVQTHQFEQNLEQGRGRDNGDREPSKKGRIRRVSMDDAMAPEEAEEAVPTGTMLETGGSTVEYTA